MMAYYLGKGLYLGMKFNHRINVFSWFKKTLIHGKTLIHTAYNNSNILVHNYESYIGLATRAGVRTHTLTALNTHCSVGCTMLYTYNINIVILNYYNQYNICCFFGIYCVSFLQWHKCKLNYITERVKVIYFLILHWFF